MNWNISLTGGKESKLTIPRVVASEIGRAQTFGSDIKRVTDPQIIECWKLKDLEKSAKESDSLVSGIDIQVVGIQSTTGHV